MTALFWGGTWIAGRVAVQEAAPFAVASYRFLIATLGLASLAWWTEGRVPMIREAGDWVNVVIMGATGIFAYNIFFLYGLRHITASRGALVVALNPVVVALVAWLVFGDRMTVSRAAGILLAMVGSLFVIGNGDPRSVFGGSMGLGEWLIIGCVVCWTLYTFAGRRATRTLSPLAATLYGSLVGWSMLTAGALAEGSLLSIPDFSWRVWVSIAFLGLLGTALAFTWYTDGVKRIGATRAAAFINLVPVAAVLLGAWLLDERLPPAVLAGGALVIVGVYITNRAAVRPRPATGQP
jgi:drug/metabolite transporter (DMT)-like permease